MADICVLYCGSDLPAVEALVTILREHWTVWVAKEIAHGDWEQAVRGEIRECGVVVPVLGTEAGTSRAAILKDEIRYAIQIRKPVLPLIVGRGDIPFGFGDLNHSEAIGWKSDDTHPGIVALASKLSATLAPSQGKGSAQRTLQTNGKSLPLPSFVFSLSSFETRITPADGLRLLGVCKPGAALVSAYDVHATRGNRREFKSLYQELASAQTITFMDSGNYEASRRRDYFHSKRNRAGWRREALYAVLRNYPADIVFSYDDVEPSGSLDAVIRSVVRDYKRDLKAIGGQQQNLCPIVHLPKGVPVSDAAAAARVVAAVAGELRPKVIAIPERELGDGLVRRARTVQAIRHALDEVDPSCALHLLGTGNPLSMAVLAVAGADLFDGLEWCRTVVDYRSGLLYHFQQFEALRDACIGRMRNPTLRRLVEDDGTPYSTKVLGYNLDYFTDWSETMGNYVRGGGAKLLLRSFPDIGVPLYDQLFGADS